MLKDYIDVIDLTKIYTVKHEKISDEGFGRFLVSIYKNDEKIGEYTRNYGGYCESTFLPFMCNGKELALYSPDYTCTRLMSLPDCTDIGGEDAHNHGFCPTEYHVPTLIIHTTKSNIKSDEDFTYIINNPTEEKCIKNNITEPLEYYPFGFVAGCYWGDDSSWKIQYLDLSKADEGILMRDERFGYIELPDKLSLKEAIIVEEYYGYKLRYIDIITQKTYKLDTGKCTDDED